MGGVVSCLRLRASCHRFGARRLALGLGGSLLGLALLLGSELLFGELLLGVAQLIGCGFVLGLPAGLAGCLADGATMVLVRTADGVLVLGDLGHAGAMRCAVDLTLDELLLRAFLVELFLIEDVFLFEALLVGRLVLGEDQRMDEGRDRLAARAIELVLRIGAEGGGNREGDEQRAAEQRNPSFTESVHVGNASCADDAAGQRGAPG